MKLAVVVFILISTGTSMSGEYETAFFVLLLAIIVPLVRIVELLEEKE